MPPSSHLRRVLYAVGIGLFVAGIAITGSAAYEEWESTPYLVQVDQIGTTTTESTVEYSALPATERAVFDRVKDGEAAPVGGPALSTFANNAVRYDGEVYSFELTHDPTSLTPLRLGFGLVVSLVGGGSCFLTRFLFVRRSQTPNGSV